MLPHCFPPRQTVYGWFAALARRRRLETINHHLVMRDRERVGREASPSRRRHRQPERQDHRSRRPARLRCRQEDQGRKRHAMVDTDGRPLVCRSILPRSRTATAPCRCCKPRVVASRSSSVSLPTPPMSATASPMPPASPSRSSASSPDQVGFAVHPRRWVVERFFAWINRNRRLAKDFEATIESATAFLYAASAMLLIRRLARCT